MILFKFLWYPLSLQWHSALDETTDSKRNWTSILSEENITHQMRIIMKVLLKDIFSLYFLLLNCGKSFVFILCPLPTYQRWFAFLATSIKMIHFENFEINCYFNNCKQLGENEKVSLIR